ncbi:MAG: GNAT family N-acetyltransferase [Candidatus Zipacnadales bacterium]
MEVSTRFAIEDDLQTLATYEREIACSSFPEDPILDLNYHYDKLKRALRSEPDGMVVLTLEEEVVGWLWMSTKISLATKERYGVLRSLYVRKDLRNQGLAKSLAQYCLRHFESRGIHRIVAKVHCENEAGKAILQRVGLKPVHITYEYRTPLQVIPSTLKDDKETGKPGGKTID